MPNKGLSLPAGAGATPGRLMADLRQTENEQAAERAAIRDMLSEEQESLEPSNPRTLEVKKETTKLPRKVPKREGRNPIEKETGQEVSRERALHQAVELAATPEKKGSYDLPEGLIEWVYDRHVESRRSGAKLTQKAIVRLALQRLVVEYGAIGRMPEVDE